MGIFGINYDRPGPGVRKDEPKKKGIRRFFELFVRKFWDIVKLNLIFCLIALPSAVLFFLGFVGIGGWYALILSIAAAFPLGGAVSACMFCIAKMLRDSPGWAGYDFRRKFRENFLQAALPGIVSAVFTYTHMYIWANMSVGRIAAGYGTIALLLVAVAFFEMIMPYVFLQTAHLSLKNAPIIKNSVILAIKDAPRSFCGMLFGRAVWIVSVLVFPLTVWLAPFLLLFGFTLSWLVNLMWIWPLVDEVFSIGAAIDDMQEQKVSGVTAVFASREPQR